MPPSTEFALLYRVQAIGLDVLDGISSKTKQIDLTTKYSSTTLQGFESILKALSSTGGGYRSTLEQMAASQKTLGSEAASVARDILQNDEKLRRSMQDNARQAKQSADEEVKAAKQRADAANMVAKEVEKAVAAQKRAQEQLRSGQDRQGSQLGRGAGQLLGGSSASSGGISSLLSGIGIGGLGLGAGLAGIGAIAGIASLTRDATQAAQQLQILSNEFGVSSSRVFQFQEAARMTGQDLGTMSQAARRLAIAIEEPGGEGKKTAEALTSMGVSLRDGVGPALDQVFKKLGDTSNQAQALHQASEVFGRDGARFVQVAQALKDVGSTGLDEGLIKSLSDAQRKLEEFDNKWTVLKAHLAEAVVVTITGAGSFWDWIQHGGKIGQSNANVARDMTNARGYLTTPPMPRAPGAPSDAVQMGDAAKLRGILNDQNNKFALQEQIAAKEQQLKGLEASARNDISVGHTQGVYDTDAQSVSKARAELKALQDREKALNKVGRAAHIDPYGDAAQSYLESTRNRNFGEIGSAMDARDEFARRFSVSRGENRAHPEAYGVAEQGYNQRLGFGSDGGLTYGQGAIGKIAAEAAKSAMAEARRNEETNPTFGYQALLGLKPITSSDGKAIGQNWDSPDMKLFSDNLRRSISEAESSHPEQTYKRLMANDSKFQISALQRQSGLEDNLRRSGGNDSANAQMMSSIQLAQKEYQLRMESADKLLSGEERITEQIQAQGDLSQQIDDARIKRQEELAAQAEEQNKQTGQFFSGWVMASLSGQSGAASNFLKDFGKQQFSRVVSNFAENTVGSMNKYVGLGRTGLLGTDDAHRSFLGNVFKGTPLDFDAKSEMSKNPLETATDKNTTATAANTAAIVQMLNAAGIDTSGIPKGGLPGMPGGSGGFGAGSLTSLAGSGTDLAKAVMSGNPQSIMQSVMGIGKSVAGGGRGLGGLLGGIGPGGTAPFLPAGISAMGGDGALALPFSPGAHSGISMPNLDGFGSGLSASDLSDTAGSDSISSSIGKAFSDNISRYPSVMPTDPGNAAATDTNAASGISKTLGGLFGGAGYGVNGYGLSAIMSGIGTNADGSLESLSGTQQIGAALGMGGQMAGGILGAVKGFGKGGARGDISGLAGSLTAAAPLTGPLAPFLDAGAGILGMVDSLLPDPREQRIKQEDRGILNQSYIRPSAHNYSFNSSGGAGLTYSEGGGMQASGNLSSTNNHYWITPDMTAQELFEQMKKDPQGLSDTILSGITSSSAAQLGSLISYTSQFGGT